MAKKFLGWKTRGMNRDLSVTAFNPEFAFENRNLRLSTNEFNTLLSWVNEKGTTEMALVKYVGPPSGYIPTTIIGNPIGTAVVNHKLIIFTTEPANVSHGQRDYIYSLEYMDGGRDRTAMVCTMLFGENGVNLNFSVEHPIETLVSYESESIQKVYWTDGINQPRVINITGTINQNAEAVSQFDFIPDLNLQEEITVEKMLGANGMFAPGVIQYAFTYYKKNGQETNIFHTTPLNYISYKDRGASPEDKVENAFKINIYHPDTNFDFLRIYSIQRTSINGTPIVKRIQDISLEGYSDTPASHLSFIDTGLTGDAVDPTELLYKGGETIIAQTMEQKDGTLFLGNINISRSMLKDQEATIRSLINIDSSSRKFYAKQVFNGSYKYYNQLTAYRYRNGRTSESVPCAGFKTGDYYRLGVQFQHKSGRWSDPIYLTDKVNTTRPYCETDELIGVPTFKAELTVDQTSQSFLSTMASRGYLRVRPVVVFPSLQDRVILCQGVINPTLYTSEQRNTNKDLYAQSSWFFRFSEASGGSSTDGGKVYPKASSSLPYMMRSQSGYGNPDILRRVEIQGDFSNPGSTGAGSTMFQIDREMVTFHSPDVEFDDELSTIDHEGIMYSQVGKAVVANTLSDIDIQTETPTVSSTASGFIHKSFDAAGSFGIVSGLFYEDYVVDDNNNGFEKYSQENQNAKWMIYPWQKGGSLNNDINRPSDKGTPTSVLKKKVISNLRVANTTFITNSNNPVSCAPQLFSSDQNTIIKVSNLWGVSSIYQGNIDTMLVPKNADGVYFNFGSNFAVTTGWKKTYSKKPDTADDQGIYKYFNNAWVLENTDIGDDYIDLVMKKESVRMKYKSTPHLVFAASSDVRWEGTYSDISYYSSLPVIELRRALSSAFLNTMFGGTSQDALKENIWVPCGDAVRLDNITTHNIGTESEYQSIDFEYSYGDTYYQRWDCLKTYAYTKEDINQVVEIGSFMLETHTNIDGRYDRNRGQINNLNMSPQNFNLLNKVYSQVDNFFNYRIMDESYYTNTNYPNQVVWSKVKSNGADVDLWTNVTLAAALDLDGDKGAVSKLIRFNDQLLCFQDRGISQILYNELTQISTEQGVPLELGTSKNVQGKRYLSDIIGCSNKWSMTSTPVGIYFMDSNEKSIYLFNGQLQNISTKGGFNTYCKYCIPADVIKWNPTFPVVNPQNENHSAFVTYYDKMNQDILFINNATALAYSEKLGVFTSFYDYGKAAFFINLDDTGIWIKDNTLWKHQAGDYCRFFGINKPYSTILIANAEPQSTKIFTNLEFRASVDNDMYFDTETQKYYPYLPFDSIEVWDEYQHGIGYLKDGRDARPSAHHTLDNVANINRKFRIWRTDIPRDNASNVDVFDETFDRTFHIIARLAKHPMDRMNNPWLYVRLRKGAEVDDLEATPPVLKSLNRTELQDIMLTYYN